MNTTFQISRRSFVKRCAATAAATGLPLWFVEQEMAAAQDAPAPSASPNERPGIALIGCGGQGGSDLGAAAGHGDVVAVCDVDDSHASGSLRRYSRATKYNDFRKVMERPEVNIVLTGHAGSLAHAGQYGGGPGQEGYLCGKAADPDD